MNKSLLTHGVWLAVSLSALAFGRTIFPAKESTTEQAHQSSRILTPEVAEKTSEGKAPTEKEVDLAKALAQIAKGADPSLYIDAFLNEQDPLKANKMFADLLLNLTPDNAQQIFDALRQSGRTGEDFGRETGLFLEAWGRLDGAKAVAAVEQLGGDGRRRSFASMSAMTGWASADPEAAKAHLATAENGWEKGMMSQGLISGLARTDPNAATDFVYMLDAERAAAAKDGADNGGDDRWRGWAADRQMESIANAQLRAGKDVATGWAEALPDGDLKAAAFDRLAENLVRDDPAGAAAWVASHADQDYAGRAVREIAEEFGRTDPKAAIEWATNLPEQNQKQAIQQTFEQWTRTDAVAASEHLSEMPESPSRDAAVGSFARQLDREDPAAAAAWATSINDPAMRTDTLNEVGSSWMRSDPEGAKVWLPKSGLSAEAQQKIIDQPQGGRGGWGR
jgi:hypothetical protein